ncbi:MAG: radical SAM protein [Dehalococcoidia bacterium]|nr:radical SAM protein [Dehalococcoidia bacterium]
MITVGGAFDWYVVDSLYPRGGSSVFDANGGSVSPAYRIDTSKSKRWWYEMGPIRPPSEGRDHSLLIRATRNCPWNRCRFCPVYKGQKFEYRAPAEVKEDIDVARALAGELKAASWRLGLGGRIDRMVLGAVVNGNPELYSGDSADPAGVELCASSLVNVANWLASGGRTAFLQDADTLIMRVPELLDVLRHLKSALPSIERITSYARAKTASRRSVAELKELRDAGLSRLHIGLESGLDDVLRYMEKGVTAEEHIRGGRAVVEAGISLSEYVMPGLGGKKWSDRHALESARVLNAIEPEFIRLRSLGVRKNTPLHEQMGSADFQVLDEDEMVSEIGLLIENLHSHSYVTSDQMSNLLWEVEGQLPEDKQAMLDTISRYLAKPPMERLRFCLERRRRSFYSIYGGFPPEVQELLDRANDAIQAESPDAAAEVNEAIGAMKQGFL